MPDCRSHPEHCNDNPTTPQPTSSAPTGSLLDIKPLSYDDFSKKIQETTDAPIDELKLLDYVPGAGLYARSLDVDKPSSSMYIHDDVDQAATTPIDTTRPLAPNLGAAVPAGARLVNRADEAQANERHPTTSTEAVSEDATATSDNSEPSTTLIGVSGAPELDPVITPANVETAPTVPGEHHPTSRTSIEPLTSIPGTPYLGVALLPTCQHPGIV